MSGLGLGGELPNSDWNRLSMSFTFQCMTSQPQPLPGNTLFWNEKRAKKEAQYQKY